MANDDTAWREPAPHIDPDERRAFLDARRRSHRDRYDRLHAATYDQEWGEISPSHRAFLSELLASTTPNGIVLDAACGTGKYWPLVLESGRRVIGADQSVGMLAVARAKFPAVPVVCATLQELALTATFDAAMCVDALEDVGPEDWPIVLDRLFRYINPGGSLYLTVEQLDEAEVRRGYETARARGDPVVAGEDFDETAYHFFPKASAIRDWVRAAGFEVLGETVADSYRHLLLRRGG